MLYDPERIIMSGSQPLSAFLAKARSCRSDEAVRTGMFGDGTLLLPGQFFEALHGLHFGVCGPLTVPSSLSCPFHCDMPAIVIIVVLEGEWSYGLKDENTTSVDVRKNMFMVGDWENVRGYSGAPAQENYCHIGISVDKRSLARLFGERAEQDILQILSAAANGRRDVCGPASPDVLAAAHHLLHMQKNGPLATLALRGAIVDFFTRLLKNAATLDPAPALPLHERDALTLTALKERIERECPVASAKEICSAIGMSESKANKGFKILFGTTIARHLHQCRMARAHMLLTRKKHTVSECAFSLGYTNIGHFIAAFRKQYGITPKDASRAA